MESTSKQSQHIGSIDQAATSNTTKTPLLKKQNFTLGRTLSIVSILITLIYIAGAVVNSLMMTGLVNIGEKQMEVMVMLTLFLSAFAILQLVITIFLFVILNKYLRNFDLCNKTRALIKGMIITMIVLTIISIFAQIPSNENLTPTFNPLVIAALVIPLLVLGVLSILAGWRLFRFKGDYVGGLSSLGLILWLSVPTIILWVIVPVMTFIVFSKADKYAYDLGFEGEK